MRLYLISFLLLLMPVLAQAEEQAAGTRMNLSATADTLLANDEVVISFRVEKQGPDAAVLRQYVNRVSGVIERQLAKQKGLKLQTLNRTMQPVWKHPKEGPRQRTGWKVTQLSRISSTRLQAVPQWLNGIETAGAQLSGLSFRVSAEVEKKTRRLLSGQAIHLFRDRAAAIAKAMDAGSFRIIRLSTASQGAQPRVYRGEMMMMSAVKASPSSLSAGENRISVTVSGDIELPFIDFPVR
ncbi:MAG: SIMPL domain-containing protein [Mariprofundus sp.]